MPVHGAGVVLESLNGLLLNEAAHVMDHHCWLQTAAAQRGRQSRQVAEGGHDVHGRKTCWWALLTQAAWLLPEVIAALQEQLVQVVELFLCMRHHPHHLGPGGVGGD
ncbi:hypothetical protein E2C01_016711 [Portunus trituberculatus]|uniref:Uncharacterized protein n=1 Tax=Portunus trituberculatus TaxID=210409 RepID=A0A5B7DPU4_PORTR|nr:hypothetical protein [Portunus trituberculatus]